MSNEDMMPKEFVQKSISNREVIGIGRAINDYKKEFLKLQDLPMTAEAMKEIIIAEKRFRITITKDLRDLIEINCAKCPLGYERNTCEAKQCPFKTIDELLKNRLELLNQILPGGVDN